MRPIICLEGFNMRPNGPGCPGSMFVKNATLVPKTVVWTPENEEKE
jgi:hypothetical protein